MVLTYYFKGPSALTQALLGVKNGARAVDENG